MFSEQRSSAADFMKSIRNIVAAYKRQHPNEYKLLKQAVQMQRKLLHDPEYARSEGDKTSDQRALYEISETLSAALIHHLSEEATVWWKTTEGGRWFARTFPEFSLPEKV